MNEETKNQSGYNKQQPLLYNDNTEDDERVLKLVEIIALLWNKKWWIALATMAITCIGLIYALIAENRYSAQAIFAPREAEKNPGAGLLSQMGSLGGIIASQMGIGNTSLDHIIVIAKSHDLASVIINKYDLLPKLFHKKYDFEKKKWTYKDTTEIPTVQNGVKLLSQKVISISGNLKTNTITIASEVYDSVLAAEIVNCYLKEIDGRLKNDIIKQSHEKKIYLEEQMRSTEDPWMLQKLQTLVGVEVEKSMIVAGSAINVLETPMVPIEKSGPRRKYIVVFSFLGGAVFSSLIVFLSYFFELGRLPEIIKAIRNKNGN